MNKDIPARRIFVFSILILLCVSFIQPLGTSSVFAQSAPPDFSRINPPWIPAALPAPVLSSPISGSYISDPTPDFTWSAVTGATEYELQISASSTFSPLKENPKNLSSTAYTSGTLIDGKYYWRVRTMTPSLGTWSSVRNFTVDTLAPAIPVLSAPTNNLTVKGTPTYSWKAALGATYYKFQHAKDTGFTSDVYTSADLKVLTHKPPLQQPGEYYWRVKAKDLAGNESDWSGYFKVTVEPTIPKAPVLTAPATGLYTNDKTPDFAWNGVDYGDHYQIQISKTSTFTAPVLIDQTLTPGVRVFTPGTDLTDAKYYWRVRAYNSNPVDSAHPGPWSSVRNFTVDTQKTLPPILNIPVTGATLKTRLPAFSVYSVSTAVRYQFQVTEGADFTSPRLDSIITSTSFITPNTSALSLGKIYSWRVRAYDAAGNISDWSLARTFELNNQNAPINNSFTTNTKPPFSWTTVYGALGYNLQVSTDPDFTDPHLVINQYPTSTSFTPATALPNGLYYWRIRVRTGSDWSTPEVNRYWKLTITPAAPPAPVLVSPTIGIVTSDTTPEFSWNAAAGADHYNIQVSLTNTFSSLITDENLSTGVLTYTPGSEFAGGMYYWRVRSLNSLNFPGAWSPSRSFTITTTRKGAWVDQLEFTAIPNISNVPNAILSGAIDLYASTISDPNIGHSYDVDSSIFNYSESTASIDQLLFNTVSCEDPNKLNPFSYMKIREAMNWAVDREYINGEILMGFGIPQYTVVNANSPDYIRYQGKMDEIVEKYRYDFVHAQSVVTEEMTTMGAILGEDGKWQYHGMPVTLIGLIRTEDSRKKIGDYFADQLEKLGFTVDRQYKLRSAASPIWNTSDWDPCLFNFYTAGWINGGISRDEGGNFAGYNDSMAGWSNGFVNYDPSPEYKEVLAKLFQNNYSTWNVRDTLFNQALDYSMQESWHGLMVSNLFDFAPYRQGLTVTSDAVTNICGNPLWPLTIQKNDSVGGIVKIAQSGILVNPWNPLYGSNWCDDITPQKATESFGTFLDPQTGVALPQRIASAAVTVQTGLPIKKTADWLTLETADTINVPEDAWVGWDASTQTFIQAGPGVTAKVKSVATYADLSNVYWHDGSRFSVADIVMGMILAFDPGKSESVLYNNAGQDISGNFLTHFKGVKIVSTDPLVIETYEDLYTLDAENNVYSWWPGSRADFFQTEYAWHMVGAGIRAEAEGKLAFEGGKANATGIPWANYVMGSSLAILNSEVVKSYNDSFIPYWPTLHNYISSSEAKTRWNNYKNWYGVHKHFWLGTGPFYLDTVSSTKLVMKRFAAFPDYASRWDAYRSLDPSGLTTPILPINKQVVPTNEPKISLIPVIGARHYQYQISEVPDFSSLVYDIKRNTPHYDMFLEELDLGKTYFWRARALDDDGNYNQWSEPRSFLTNIMIWPENEIYLLPATVFFNWKYVAPTSLVNLQVANDSSFDPESIVIDQTMNGQLFHSFIPGTTLPPGKYYWRMRINDFHEWREFTPFWTFTVTRFQPELVSPLDGSSSPVTTPLLDWDPVIGGDHFQVQVSSLEDFSSLIINENLSPGLDSFEIVSSLTDGLYYWRVRGITVSDITLPWSESWSFRVDNIPPTAPVLVNPIGGQVLNTGKLALSVDGTTEDTTNYQFQVSTSSDFSTTALVDETIASPNYSLTDGEALPLGHTYYWRAKAIDGAGFESPWSAGDSFSLTILNSPINGATTANLRPTFSWLGVQGASEYKIQIGTDTSFSGGALVSEITQSDTFYTPPSDFSEGSYYWQVAVHLPSGWSDFMPYWSLNLDEDAVESRNGGWLDGLVFNVNGDAGNAVSQIQSGALDIYPEILANVNLFETVKGDPSLAYDITLVSFDQLMFNTVGCATGTNKLNPFTNMKIREAMNWAVNREYIADTIFGGLAKPKFTLLTTDFPDYYRYKTTIDSIASNYAFDLSKAQTVVDTEMTSMGAFKNGSGKWVYNFGSIISPNIQPVTIIGLIRTEDKRLQIGDYFADQLELLGFTVDRQHKTRSQASPIWQGTDLDQCRFNFYTAGWINTSVSRDEGNMFAQFNSSMIQLIPLFEHYAPSTSYLNTMTKLMNNNFADMSERDSLFNQALDDSMAESWHGLMAVDETGFTPRVTNLKVASDLVGGTVTPFWPYTIRFEGKTGGEVHASLDSILNGVWNPIAGSNWYNDLIIQKGTGDAGVIPDPLTGLNHAKRIENAEVIVLDGLPMQKTEDWITLDRAASIPVPTDAWVDWDATTQHFITAGTKYPGGLTARAKVVVTYPDLSGIKWQDGSSFSVADVVMYMILGFDRAKPESAIYDESSVGLLDAVMSSFKGVRIISTDPLTIESYTDMISLDAESLISGYNGWGGGFNFTWWPDYSTGEAPWHMIAAGIKAETEGLLAFSAEKSSALGIEPTNYIAGPALDTLKNKIGESAATGHIPYLPTLGAYITSTEAKNRWTNYQDWFATHEHLWVGSGPYFIDQVYPIESKIILKWFNNYPDISDKWDSLIP